MKLKTPLFKKPYIELENEQEKELFKLDKDKEIKRLKEEYVMLQNASDKVEEEKDREIERLHKGIKEIIQNINSLEIGSDQETYNKDGYQVDVYDIEDMLVELIGSDKE